MNEEDQINETGDGLNFLNKFAVRIFGRFDHIERLIEKIRLDHEKHLGEQDLRLERIEALQTITNGRVLESERVTKPIATFSDIVAKHFWKIMPPAFVLLYVSVYILSKIGDVYVSMFLKGFGIGS